MSALKNAYGIASIRRLRRFGAWTLLATFLLSACAFSTNDSVSVRAVSTATYPVEIAQIRLEAHQTGNADLILKILEDDLITDEEILELNAQHTQCMHDKGIPEFNFDPFTGEHHMPQEMLDNWTTWMPSNDECAQETGSFIVEAIWNTIRKNPHHVDDNEYLVACLAKLSVIDPAFSGSDLQEVYESWSKDQRENDNLSSTEVYGPMGRLPFIVSMEEGMKAVERCTSEPQKVMYGSEEK